MLTRALAAGTGWGVGGEAALEEGGWRRWRGGGVGGRAPPPPPPSLAVPGPQGSRATGGDARRVGCAVCPHSEGPPGPGPVLPRRPVWVRPPHGARDQLEPGLTGGREVLAVLRTGLGKLTLVGPPGRGRGLRTPVGRRCEDTPASRLPGWEPGPPKCRVNRWPSGRGGTSTVIGSSFVICVVTAVTSPCAKKDSLESAFCATILALEVEGGYWTSWACYAVLFEER